MFLSTFSYLNLKLTHLRRESLLSKHQYVEFKQIVYTKQAGVFTSHASQKVLEMHSYHLQLHQVAVWHLIHVNQHRQ